MTDSERIDSLVRELRRAIKGLAIIAETIGLQKHGPMDWRDIPGLVTKWIYDNHGVRLKAEEAERAFQDAISKLERASELEEESRQRLRRAMVLQEEERTARMALRDRR